MVSGKDVEILNTNLQPFFWRKVKNIIRQNKKGALLEFLFGLQDDKIGSTPNTYRIKGLEEKIQILENLVASLQERVIHLAKLGPYCEAIENQRNINMLSAPDRMPKNEYSKTGQGNLSFSQNQAQNRPNFITLEKISEQEKKEIIKTGFQFQAQRKIFLKKYYEGRGE